MNKNVIHIFGASGSGTTTLGRYLSEKYGFYHMDTDDYFWEKTDPPYTTKRDPKQRVALMQADINMHQNVVISGSFHGWGDALIPYFTLAIRVVTDTAVRIERIKRREKEKLGERITPGGDMYGHHLEFLNWASRYDTGDLSMRSKASHDAWQKTLPCPLLEIDGCLPLEQNLKHIAPYIKE